MGPLPRIPINTGAEHPRSKQSSAASIYAVQSRIKMNPQFSIFPGQGYDEIALFIFGDFSAPYTTTLSSVCSDTGGDSGEHETFIL